MVKASWVRRRFLCLFREYAPLSNDDGGKVGEREQWEIRRRSAEEIDGVLIAVRKFVMRGSSAGALASLTLFGSQILAEDPKVAVFLTLLAFLLSLGFGFFQLGIAVWRAMLQRSIDFDTVWEVGEKAVPPRILDWATWLLDGAAIAAMLVGIYLGLHTLYGLTQVTGSAS